MSREQREVVDALLRKAPQVSGPQSVHRMRAGFSALMSTMQNARGVRITDTTLGGRGALLVEPETDAQPGTILYFHGGGYVFGSPETAMSLTSALVTKASTRSISIDYRLAPEHPFPAGLDDALSAYKELLDSGIQPGAIAFAGDSAGGGIAVTACLRVRDVGLPMPSAVVAFSPSLDRTLSGRSMETKAGIDPIFTQDSLKATNVHYLAGQDPDQELISPAIHANLTGFPPLLLQVGTNEVLLDDSTRLAERAWAAGVDVILDVTADVPHVFQSFTGVLDEADQALDRAALFLAQHLRHRDN